MLNLSWLSGRAPAGRAIRYKSSPFVPHGCGLFASIPHATVTPTFTAQQMRFTALLLAFVCSVQVTFGQTSSKPLKKKAPPHTVNKKASPQNQSSYEALFKSWCDGVLVRQVSGGENDGGIFCQSHQFVHGRSVEVVYPFLAMYHLSGNEKYKTAAIKAYNWAERHVSQPDGSWINEPGGKNPWQGITCFRVIALGEALLNYGHLLPEAENKRIRARLRKGADFIISFITFETGDINYPISASASLAITWKILGDEKYLKRSQELANFGLKHFTTNNLIWGEGVRGINDTTAKGLRPIDIPYNIEESLPNLAIHATITGDKKVLDIVTKSMQTHLNWMLPDGGLDAGWCSRQYKWNYYGTSTAEGGAGGFALMANRDKRFAEAALRSMKIRESYTHNGLLHGGADLVTRNAPVCIQHTIANLKGLTTAIHKGLSGSLKPGKIALPSDNATGVKEWPEASVLQISHGPWRASVTTNDLATSPKRGNHPMGGALSMLWNKNTGGPVAVASMNNYVRYEPSNMQQAKNASEEYCLTPRIETLIDSVRYTNLYDSKAKSIWVKNGKTVQVKVTGNLRDSKGELMPGASSAYEISYTFEDSSFQMSVHSAAASAKLIFPVISPASERVYQNPKGELIIQKKAAQIKLTSSKALEWDKVAAKRMFNFVPGFEALAVENGLDAKGNCTLRIDINKP